MQKGRIVIISEISDRSDVFLAASIRNGSARIERVHVIFVNCALPSRDIDDVIFDVRLFLCPPTDAHNHCRSGYMELSAFVGEQASLQ